MLCLAPVAASFLGPAAKPTRLSKVSMVQTATPSVWADPIAGHGSQLDLSDIPWDPLGLANDLAAEDGTLLKYREAEIKHGRIAMLAALGWPAAEEFEPLLAKATGRFDELAETGGRAPSLLNGGLEEAQIPWFLLAVAIFTGFAEKAGTKYQEEYGLEPGNVGFDPLNLFETDAETQEKFRIAELKHGRIAMIAIFLYALEEAISGTSILKETAPLAGELEKLALEGPIQGNIDLVKDLTADAKALVQDVEKETNFYEKALAPGAKPIFK